MEDKKLLGDLGERLAAAMLYSEGYEILERKYRGRRGEIDIIAKNEKEIAFTEVKTRSTLDFGRPCEAINSEKQRKIKNTAREYLLKRKDLEGEINFKVIEILVSEIDNAF